MIPTLLLAALALLPLNESSFKTVVAREKGQVVLVNFWATWCGPCREEMPQLAAMQKRLKFRLLTVSVDEPEQNMAAATFLEKSGIGAPAYRKQTDKDDAFIAAIAPKWSGAVPALFLYGRDGKLIKSYTGEPDLKKLEAELKKLL